MSDLEVRIAAVLQDHVPEPVYTSAEEGYMACYGCDWRGASYAGVYAHQASMLAPLIAAHVAEEAYATITAYVEAWPGFRSGWGHDPESIGARAIANKTVTWLRARWKEAAP